MHKFDIICISETFLNKTYEDNDLIICPSGSSEQCKWGGVCIYYKETLALKMISIPYLNECLLCEVTIGSKKCITVIILI